MEPEAVQSSFLLKRVKALYAWFVILVFILAVAFLVYYKLNATPTEETTAPPLGTEKALVKVGIPVELAGVFPATIPESSNVAFSANIFEGLTIWRNGKVVHGLAISWSNPDTNTWRFKLRSGVTFSNGNKFSADDVKYSIEKAQASAQPNPQNGWSDAAQVANIASATVVDSSTVEIKTAQPDPVLLPKLATVFIISKEQAEKEGLTALTGTGPYKLKAFEKGTYTLEANQNYWGGKPKVKQVVYKFISPPQAAEALTKGDIDITTLFSSTDNAKLAKQNFAIETYRLPAVYYLTFDFNKDKTPYTDTAKNPFKDKRVRQALLYGINIDELIKNAVPAGEPTSQLVTSDIFGYDLKIKRPAYNLEKAKTLLAEAGYPNGFSVTFDIPAAFQTDQEITKQLERLGIKATARFLTEQKDLERIMQGDFSLFANAIAPETLDMGEILNDSLHTQTQTEGGYNSGGYSNTQLDKLTEEASATFDSKKRLALLQQATAVAINDVAWIPLYTTEGFAAVKSGFAWTPQNFGLIYAYEITGR